MNILTNLNLNKNELQNLILHPLAVAPANPAPWQVYTNSTDGLIYQNHGTAADPEWVAVGSVLSVNGQTGVVVLTQDDVGDGETYVRTHNDLTNNLKTLLENTPTAIAPTYSDAATYAVGDYVTKDGLLYYCNTAISTAETWTVSHWTAITVAAHFAPIDSPALTGVPTAPTAAVGTNTTQIATTAYVLAAITEVGNAMVFKGIVNADSDLPATHTAGWVYKVGTAGTYVGQTCEVGDSIVCVTTGTVAANADWYVLQANIDGAVTGPASAIDGHVAVFDGTSGKIIKDGYGVATTAENDNTKLATAGAVHGLIKAATGTIGTTDTSAVVNYSGTLVEAYASVSGAKVLTEITCTANSVTFTTAQAPSAAVTCTVVYADI